MPRKMRGQTQGAIVQAARDLRRDSTNAEAILWAALRGRQLNGLKFRRQHPLGQFVLDLFCVEHQLAIELDGGIHQLPDQVALDAARTEFLLSQNIQVLRFKNQDVENHLNAVLQKIVDAISSPAFHLEENCTAQERQ